MSELLQLLTMKPYPLPAAARRHTTEQNDSDEPNYCPKCERDGLLIENFYVRADGRCSAYCKKCTNEITAEQRRKAKAAKGIRK